MGLWVADLVWEVNVTSANLTLDQPDNQTSDQTSDWPNPIPVCAMNSNNLTGLGKTRDGDYRDNHSEDNTNNAIRFFPELDLVIDPNMQLIKQEWSVALSERDDCKSK